VYTRAASAWTSTACSIDRAMLPSFLGAPPAGLVLERRQGNRRLYRADRRALRPLQGLLREMWRSDLEHLARLVEEEEGRRRRS
jgi:hypothetical protein